MSHAHLARAVVTATLALLAVGCNKSQPEEDVAAIRKMMDADRAKQTEDERADKERLQAYIEKQKAARERMAGASKDKSSTTSPEPNASRKDTTQK